MGITLEHPEAKIQIDELENSKRRITVQLFGKTRFIPYNGWVTSYSLELISEILNVKGPRYLCDEIMRDESPSYTQQILKVDLLAFVAEGDFERRRILDFGCGAGASTMILARMFPKSQIVGIELKHSLLSIARKRADFYHLDNVVFYLSPSGDQLPPEIKTFDYIILGAVYEHLLPDERKLLLSQLWSILNPEGVMFIGQTPHRFFPIEPHTTYMPLINYLPDRLTHWLACRFSNQVDQGASWHTLLRRGIRGATEREILRILKQVSKDGVIPLNPHRLGINDKIDLWYAGSTFRRYPRIKRVIWLLSKATKYISGLNLVPYISIAVKKTA